MKKIHPWTLTGLIDAEGSLGVSIVKDTTRKSNYVITLFLEIGLNVKDKTLLERIQTTLGVGNIYYISNDNTYKWKVSNINQLSNVIIPHLTIYPLLTQKRADFELFVKIIEIIKRKEHISFNGLQEIVNLKASLNLGLTDSLKSSFPNTVAVPRPKVIFKGIPDPNWLMGFAEGEAYFFTSIYKSLKSKLGLAVQLVFKITQHSRDIELLKGIEKFFACGRVEKRSTDACDFTVNSLKDFDNKIVPFFLKYPLQGSKLENFKDFNKIVQIMKVKGHLKREGLETIKSIKVGMNTGRKE
jgi:LAGLIDADG DNA endonuclease family protein